AVFGGELSLQVDGNYQSKVWHNLNNFDANRLNGYVLANSRVRWVSEDYNWSVDLFVNNLFDKGYDNVGFDLSQICGCTLIAQGKPRWAGIKVGTEF
ncbi:MAG: TonB-dependent receptor, partial [Sphingomonadales bacterium]